MKNPWLAVPIVIAALIAFFFISSVTGFLSGNASKFEYCNQYEGEELDLCLSQAGAYGGIVQCEKISRPDVRDTCLLEAARFHQKNRFVSLDQLCGKISDSEIQKYCSALSAKNPDLCSGLSQADSCYRDIAIAKNDKSICFLATEGERDWCIFFVYNSRGWPTETLCEKIEETGARDICWHNLANFKSDWNSFCPRIENPEKRAQCFETPKNSALFETQLIRCSSIENPEARSECIAKIE